MWVGWIKSECQCCRYKKYGGLKQVGVSENQENERTFCERPLTDACIKSKCTVLHTSQSNSTCETVTNLHRVNLCYLLRECSGERKFEMEAFVAYHNICDMLLDCIII